MKNRTCGECKHYYDNCGTISPNIIADYCEDFVSRTMTNGDRIRSMSDEELAELINRHWCYCCGYVVDDFGNCNSPAEKSCEESILEWLKKEVEE
jgi:hypothetical protein